LKEDYKKFVKNCEENNEKCSLVAVLEKFATVNVALTVHPHLVKIIGRNQPEDNIFLNSKNNIVSFPEFNNKDLNLNRLGPFATINPLKGSFTIH